MIGVGELPKKFRHVDDEDEQLASSLREELEERAAINAGLPGMDAPAMLPAEGLDLKDYLANLEQGLIQQAPRRRRRSGRAGRRTPAHPPHHAGREDAQVRHEPA